MTGLPVFSPVMSPSLIALLVQVAATAVTLVFFLPAFGLLGVDIPLMFAAFIQGGIAAAACFRFGLASWWVPINLLFVPMVLWALTFGIAPVWFLAAFFLLFLVFWSVYRSQVPLYLSSRKAWAATVHLLPAASGFAMLDLGAGLGGMLKHLSIKRPDGRFYGMEIAPMPFALAWLRKIAGRGAYQISWGNFWAHNLAGYDVVYAYLSPVPMTKLWVKACLEMLPGSRFISNTFPVPEVKPEEIVELDDFHRSRLYVYRIPARQGIGVAP